MSGSSVDIILLEFKCFFLQHVWVSDEYELSWNISFYISGNWWVTIIGTAYLCIYSKTSLHFSFICYVASIIVHLLWSQKIAHVKSLLSAVLFFAVSVIQNSQSWLLIFPEWSFIEETVKGIMFLDCTVAPCMTEVWNESIVMAAWTCLNW